MSLNVFEAFKTKQAPRPGVPQSPAFARPGHLNAATWGLARRCGWGSLVDDFPSTGMTCFFPLFQLSFQLGFRGRTCMLEGISMSKRWCKLHSLCASFLRLSECHLSCLQWAECFTLSGIPANLYFFHLVHEIVQSLCDLQCLQHPLPWKSSWNNMKTVCLHFAYAAKCNKDAYRSRKKIHLVKGTADLEVRSLYHDRTFPAFSNSCYRSLLSPLLLSRWGWEIPQLEGRKTFTIHSPKLSWGHVGWILINCRFTAK